MTVRSLSEIKVHNTPSYQNGYFFFTCDVQIRSVSQLASLTPLVNFLNNLPNNLCVPNNCAQLDDCMRSDFYILKNWRPRICGCLC